MKRSIIHLFTLLIITFNINAQNQLSKPKQQAKSNTKPAISNSKPIQQKSKTNNSNKSFADSLSQLKAVLVVGPCEGTKEDIENLKEVASYLRGLKVHVCEYYHPEANWDSITNAAKGAHIFIYMGHGTLKGDQGKPGGLVISKPKYISSSTISEDLKLHKNALVLFESVCYSAGSTAGDNGDIGIKTAVERVRGYARPFIQLGVAGYYACNTTGSALSFLEDFLKRKSIKEIYENHYSFTYKNEYTQNYENNQGYIISLTNNIPKQDCFFTRTSYTNGVRKEEKIKCFKEYNKAFVGIPSFSVKDFWK